MLKFGNKEFRNLQEQVKKNMDDIMFILQEEGVLNEFGIKVVGQEESVLDMPTVEEYKEEVSDWQYGDAYAIGTEAPYELYILTRANGSHPNDYWFNIGEFPMPGPQGETGPQGQTGPSGADGVSPEFSIGTVSASTISAGESATASVTQTGTYAQPVLNFSFGIPQGQDGETPSTIAWGNITGSLIDQTDLVSALQGKANASALSQYALLSGHNEFTSWNHFVSDTTFSGSITMNSNLTIFGNTVDIRGHTLLGGNVNFYSNSVYFASTTTPIFSCASIYAGSKELTLPSQSGTIALTRDIPSLSGYATQSWVSSNFLSVGTSIYGAALDIVYGDTTININDIKNALSSNGIVRVTSTTTDENNYDTVEYYELDDVVETVNYYDVLFAHKTKSIDGIILDRAKIRYNKLLGTISWPTMSSAIATDIEGIELNGNLYVPSEGYITLPDYPSTAAAVWGSITGTLSDQTDLMSKFSEYATLSDISGLASEGYVDSSISALSSVYAPVGSYASQADIDALSSVYAPIGDYATTSALSSAISGVNSTISSLDYLSVGALSSETVIPDTTGLASEGYVNSAVSALSSVYAYASDVANMNYASVGALSSGTVIPDITGLASETYVDTSISALSSVYASQAELSNYALIGDVPVISGTHDVSNWTTITINSETYNIPGDGGQTNPEWGDLTGTLSNQTDLMSKFSEYAKLSVDNIFTGSNRFSSVYFNNRSAIYGKLGNSWLSYSLPASSGTLALTSDIPSLSEYAELSDTNTFLGVNIFSNSVSFVSAVYFSSMVYMSSTLGVQSLVPYASGANIGNTTMRWNNVYANNIVGYDLISKSVSQLATLSDINALSSIYAPSDYIPTAISGYASETWTFTLSDDTTVSKTILVG